MSQENGQFDPGMGNLQLQEEDIRHVLNQLKIDHIDFGCSKGGSLEFAKKRFEGKCGLGIDIDDTKIAQTRIAGYHALRYDILDIPDEKLVRFVVMSHFLEHVPSPALVKQFIRKACTIASEFVYIQQPFFDADPYLFERGLKLFWSDWTGHQNRMTSLELWLILRDLAREGLPITFSLHAHKLVADSTNTSIHSIYSPKDQHGYSAELHPAKETIHFDDNVFAELICLITLPGCNHEEILHKLRYHRTIISADSRLGNAVANTPKSTTTSPETSEAPRHNRHPAASTTDFLGLILKGIRKWMK